MTTNTRLIDELARQFYRDIHSAAGENFLSSIINSAINENRNFRKWWLNKAGYDKRTKSDSYYSTANTAMPYCIMEHRRSNNYRIYSRPDIIIQNSKENEIWEELDEYRNQKKKLMQNLHGIFIEVKWSHISQDDYNKYLRFINRIGSGKEKWKYLKFLIVTSLSKKRIHAVCNGSHEIPGYLKPFKKLSKKNIPIISFEEIYEVLGRIKSSFPVSMLLHQYLQLYVDIGKKNYWKYVNDWYRKISPNNIQISDLRLELVDCILDIAFQSGYLPQSSRIKKDAEGKNHLIFKGNSVKYKKIKNDSLLCIDIINHNNKKRTVKIGNINNYNPAIKGFKGNLVAHKLAEPVSKIKKIFSKI